MARSLVPLTDQQLSAIATAPADVSAAQLARELGAPYFTVAKARQRIQAAGAWFCPLTWATCSECGGPLAHGSTTRTVHPGCAAGRAARYSRGYRQGPHRPSTPYVARWRREHPEDNHAHREQEKARLRELWPTLPEETRRPVLERWHAADRRDYARTRDAAEHRGEPWDADEDRSILDHLQTPAREVALELGRTLWAVRSRRMHLRRVKRPPESPQRP